jgi:hypothetical protein
LHIIDNTWVDLIIFFSKKKRIYKKLRKKILNYAYMLKNGVGRYDIFFQFLHKACWILLFVSFSCRRRKYVAVWFSSIQSRLQCLPAQYSCIHTTYTVNSFGKAFAHVRNCLLKKKHMAQTKTLTNSTRKRHKKEDSASFV